MPGGFGVDGRQLTSRRRWLKETKGLLAAAVRPLLGEEGLLLAGEGDRRSEAMGNDPARSLVGGDEAVLWCCLWSVDGERDGSVGCGQKMPLLEVG